MNDLHVDPVEDVVSQFSLSVSEKTREKATLDNLGIIESKYCCFQDRSYRYKQVVANDIGRQDYLGRKSFETARLTNLETYYPAVDEMASLGIKAVRIGAHPDQKATNNQVIDYPYVRDNDNDFPDIALMSYCKFFVGPATGLWLFARSLHRPVCLVNVFPWPWINVPLGHNDLVIPKTMVESKKTSSYSKRIS